MKYKGLNFNKYIFLLFLILIIVDIFLIVFKFNVIVDYCLEMFDLML